MNLVLYSSLSNARTTKILIAAEILKVPLKHHVIDYKDLKSKEFLAKHPLGKMPVLDTPEGPIFESFTILRYIARKANALYGASSFEKALIESWLDSCLSELDQITIGLLGAVCGFAPKTKVVYNSLVKEIKDWCKILDTFLKDKTYLVGNSISIADIAVASYIRLLLRVHLDEKARTGLAHLVRWFNQVASLPAFVNVVGKTWFCEKEFQPIFADEGIEEPRIEKVEKVDKVDKPKPEKKQVPKSEEKGGDKKQKKEEKKKEQKNKDMKKKEQEGDDEDAPEVEKRVNPLDLLPKSPFVLDDFKREISNAQDKASVLKSFWEKFDSEGWSLWKTVYDKYEGEGAVGYLTSNLKNGFLRNLEHFRKYAFAAFGVYGVEGKYDIKGVWLWRGTKIPLEMKEHQSFEYYQITPLDPNSESDRNLVEQYWLNLEEGSLVEGSPVYEVKHFK